MTEEQHLSEQEYPAELWRRITTIATSQTYAWPDMNRERFALILSRTVAPTALDLVRIGERFDVTVEWLLTGENSDREVVIAELRRWCHAQVEHQRKLEERIVVLTARLEELGGDVSG